jgi:hypothetical protein
MAAGCCKPSKHIAHRLESSGDEARLGGLASAARCVIGVGSKVDGIGQASAL